jgi:hypothetical protein
MKELQSMLTRLVGWTGLFLLLTPACVHALDLTAFASQTSPSSDWGRGYGGAIGARFFGLLTVEGEGAWYGGLRNELSTTTLSAAALVSPPVGPLTPYGGIYVGTYRQATQLGSDYGTLRGVVLGVRASLLTTLVLKAECRTLELSGDPLVPMNYRLSLGAGISF